MVQSGRLAYLMARKAQLDAEVQRETTATTPDQLRLSALKRKKLLVKDEIRRVANAS